MNTLERQEKYYSEGDHNFPVFNDENFVFYGNKSILDDNPVIVSIKLPDSEWHLAGTAPGGWDKFIYNKRLFFRFYELFFIILITFIVYLISSKQASILTNSTVIVSLQRFSFIYY